jgi:2-keto-4-pentenoate hydratase
VEARRSVTPAQEQQASDILWRHWQDGTRFGRLPDGVCPATRPEGYAIQARVEARSAAPLFGWKIAATSTAGQAHIAVDGPLAGRILRERAFEATPGQPCPDVPFGVNHMRVAEAEFAFRMARDLAPRATAYAVPEVLDAVATLHPSIEIPDSRFDDFTVVGAPQLIADNACGHYFVLGVAAPDAWRSLDLPAHVVHGAVVGRLQRDGLGANVLGDPRVALTWLVNELSGLGLTLRAGEVVTTGTCLVPLDIQPSDHVVMDFGVLGRVEARLGVG